MDEVIYVSVKWNEKDNRLEIEPSSIELTDAVGWVCWTADTPPPKPAVKVRFQGSVRRGPFKKLVDDHGNTWGSGNRGTRTKRPRFSYNVVFQSSDGPKSGSGRVINRATKKKPAKRRPRGPVIPETPAGPPD